MRAPRSSGASSPAPDPILHLERGHRASRVLRGVGWVLIGGGIVTAVASFATGAPWPYPTASAVLATCAAVVQVQAPRCAHWVQTFKDVEGIGYSCRRGRGHRGLHRDHTVRWDDARQFHHNDWGRA